MFFRPALAAVVSTAVFLSGCASWVAQIIPVGQPVTVERCESLKMRDFGLQDGQEGRRQGERFEFWFHDCKAMGVKLDRGLYDAGYEDGIGSYCSCEKGFESGVKSEFTEFRGQYYHCSKSDYGQFLRGHSAGSDYSSDPRYVKRISEVKSEYDDAAIQAKAADVCPKIPGNGTSGPSPGFRTIQE